MATFDHFSDIHGWQSAKEIAVAIYAMTSESPLDRDFGLRDQLRRSAVSVMSNIAEGFGRGGDREFLRYLDIARGSAAEVQSLLSLIAAIHPSLKQRCDDLTDATDRTILLIARLAAYLKKADKDSP